MKLEGRKTEHRRSEIDRVSVRVGNGLGGGGEGRGRKQRGKLMAFNEVNLQKTAKQTNSATPPPL